MIRLIQRRLIVPRGDTGTFSIPVLAGKDTGDASIFTIFNPLTHRKIFEKVMQLSDGVLTMDLSHGDTVNLPVGQFVWDIKFYTNPTIADGHIVDGEEVDSYYAAFTLPVCEIRETGDNLLMSDEAPQATLSPGQVDYITASINEVTDSKNAAASSAAEADTSATNAETSASAAAVSEQAAQDSQEAALASQQAAQIAAEQAIASAEAAAETAAQIEADLASKANIADLDNVAFSGDYNDLSNTPSIPSIEGLATVQYVDEKTEKIVAHFPINLRAGMNSQSLTCSYTIEELSTLYSAGKTIIGSLDMIAPVDNEDKIVQSILMTCSIQTANESNTFVFKIDSLAEEVDLTLLIEGYRENNQDKWQLIEQVGLTAYITNLNGAPELEFDAIYGRIINLKTPVNATDAATKGYVDNALPTKVSQLQNDSGYLTTHQDISGKANSADLATVATSGSYNDLLNKPFIPSAVSDLTDDSGHYTKPVTGIPASDLEETYLTSFTETDPTVPEWAKASTKPSYTAQEVGAPTVQEMNNALADKMESITVIFTMDPENQNVVISDTSMDVIKAAYHDGKIIYGVLSMTEEIVNMELKTIGEPVVYNVYGQEVFGIMFKMKGGDSDIVIIGSTNLNNDEVSWTLSIINYLKATGSENYNARNTKITNVSAPTNDKDAANKKYVDDTVAAFTETDPTVPSWAKAQTKPTYTASEVGAPTVAEMNTAIGAAIGNVHQFELSIVQELPTQNINTHTIYLVPKTGETNDVYDEYIYINNAWEMIGNTQIDLSNYATKNEVTALIDDTAGVGDTDKVVSADKYATDHSALLSAINDKFGRENIGNGLDVEYDETGEAVVVADVVQSDITALQNAIDGKEDKPDLVVTFTLAISGGVWTATSDKTVSEIVAAFIAGKIVEAYAVESGIKVALITRKSSSTSVYFSGILQCGFPHLAVSISGRTDSADWRVSVTKSLISEWGDDYYDASDARISYLGSPTDPQDAATKDYVDNAIPSVPVQDVQVNGSSILNNGTANIPLANVNTFGVLKVGYATSGLTLDTDGYLKVTAATSNQIKLGEEIYRPITPVRQHEAVFYGLAKAAGDSTQSVSTNAVGVYTADAKSAIQNMLGVPSTNDLNIYATKADTVLTTTLSRGRKADTVVGEGSFAFGNNVVANNVYTHAEGTQTNATGNSSHAEGQSTTASGMGAHAEGGATTASGSFAHAEGMVTFATGEESHAEGLWSTTASGLGTHAEGAGVEANANVMHAQGMYNIPDTVYPIWTKNTQYNIGDKVRRAKGLVACYKCIEANQDEKWTSAHWELLNYVSGSEENTLFEIGNGTGENTRSNALRVDWDGNEYIAGNLYINSNTAATEGSRVATVAEVAMKLDATEAGLKVVRLI